MDDGSISLILHRYSSFQRQPGSTASCPPPGAWLNPEWITSRASVLLQTRETMDPPYLTYDQNPDRLAWAINVHMPDGTTQVIFVAGEYAYRKE